jgi:peptide deformylase
MEFSGYDARCFLHEYDHLEGITFVNPARVSKLRLDMALKKQKKAIKELEHGRA